MAFTSSDDNVAFPSGFIDTSIYPSIFIHILVIVKLYGYLWIFLWIITFLSQQILVLERQTGLSVNIQIDDFMV